MTLPISKAETSEVADSKRIAITIAYFAALVMLGLSTAALGPTLPTLAEHTRTNLGQISFLFTARSLGYMLGSLRGGRAYDRTPGHPIMAGSLVVMAIMLFLVPLNTRLWILVLILLLLGTAEGTLDVGGNTLLLWVNRKNVGPLINGLHFFFGVGAFLSPIIIAQVMLVSGGITWAYWILACIALPIAIWLARLPSPKALVHAKAAQAEKGNSLLIGLIVLLFFLYVGAEAGFGGWIYTYTLRQFGNMPGVSSTAVGQIAVTAAYLTSAYWGSFTLGRLLGIPLASRFRPSAILLVDILGCLVSAGIILVWPRNLTAIWIGTICLGLFTASVFPTLLDFAQRRIPVTGRTTGWFFVGASLGSMTLPWLMGQLFEGIGPISAIWAVWIDTLIMLGVFFVLMALAPRPLRAGD